MFVNKKSLILFLLFAVSFADAQKLKKDEKQIVTNLQQYIGFLANDKLEGRRTGTPGEAKAAAYIAEAFKKAGLSPKGTNSYLQTFDIAEGKQINPSTFLTIDGKNLALNKEFFPLVFSADTVIEALPSMVLQEPGTPWFFDLKDLLQSNRNNPHFDLNEAIVNTTKIFSEKGASAVFLYNSSSINDGLQFNGKEKLETAAIPVVYITKEGARKFLNDPYATIDVKLKVDIEPKQRTGINVIGYIDNGAPATVIIGAHFDHLGHGEDGGSTAPKEVGQIHNGADDNASGTAAVLEMARLLKNSKLENNNYLFIAFSGEELGLFGSKYFTQHPTIDLSSVNYMINMDMVGRLSDSSHVLTVGGYGTSPSWGEIYHLSGRKALYDRDLQFRFDSSGTGASDHTSFYLQNIPVLFYFTGVHHDYHKPSDDANKINYVGEMNVIKHIMSVIEAEDRQNQKLVFTKTRDAQASTSTRFSVTLGIMPDYSFSGTGVRVDDVLENRPAQKAGIKAGDVILSIGDYKTSSLEAYMKALSAFNKGDKTTVSFLRAGQVLSSAVEF